MSSLLPLLPHLFAAPMLSLSVSQLGQLLNQAFGSLGGQVNAWLIGLVLAPMVYLLGWQSGLGPALGVGSYYAPTPIFPWRLPLQSPYPNGLAFTIGVLAFGFIALKLIADLVDGRASLRSSGPALVVNGALILFAPLLVWTTVNLGFNHFAPQLVAAALHGTGQHGIGTLSLAMSLLGYDGSAGAKIWAGALLAMAAVGSLGDLSGLAGTLAHIGQITLTAPTMLVFFWALSLDVVLLEVLAAFLFLGLTPVTPILFGAGAISMNTARTWLQLFARAMLAIILTFGLGLLWYQWFGPTPSAAHYASGFASGTLMLSTLGHAGTAVLGVGLYLALAFVLWVLWLRPLLLVAYHAVEPIATGVLKGGATAAAVGAHFSPRGKGEDPGDTALGHAATALAAAGDALSAPAVQRVLTFGSGGALDRLSAWQNPAAGMSPSAGGMSLHDALMSSVSRSTSTPQWGAAAASGSQLLRLMPHSYREERDPRDPDAGAVTVGTFTAPSPALADLFTQQFSGTTLRAQRVPAGQPRSTAVQVTAPDVASIEAVVERFGQAIDRELRNGELTPVFKLGGKYVIQSNGIEAEVPASILKDPGYVLFGEVRR